MGIVAIEDDEAGQAVACGQCTRVVVVPATRVSPGSVIGDFVIDKKLGQGGVGVVYLAQQLSLDRKAALKILNPEFSQDASYVADFIREARAAAHLNYPAIVQAYAVGEEDGLYYFAMEYVEGTSLKQVLAHSGRIVVDRALQIIKEINGALEFAWVNQKLVHRDIKPDNIILTENGRIKLADLGLARRAADLLEEGASEEVMGTPQYIPPEALLQKPLDNRSDIYSLGATLYHTVTGRFPFLADSPADIARKHLTERLTPPKTVVPDLPDNIAKLIEVMMAKRPEHRYANSTELARDINLVMQGKMPAHPLHMDSQKPIPIEGVPSPEKKDGGRGGRKLTINRRPGSAGTGAAGTGAPRTTSAPAAAETPAPVPSASSSAPATGTGAPRTTSAPPPQATGGKPGTGLRLRTNSTTSAPPAATGASSSQAPKEKPKKKDSKTLMWLFFGGTFIVLAALGIFLALKVHNSNKTPDQLAAEEIEGDVPDLYPKYIELYRAAKDRQWDAAWDLRKQFETSCGGKADPYKKLLTRVRAMSDFAVEEKLSAWRREEAAKELKSWQDEVKAKQEAEAKQQKILDEEKRIKDEEERLAKLKADEEARKLREKEALEAQQPVLRREAAELARQGRFAEASQKFIPMSSKADYPETAAWAKAKRAMYERADGCRALVVSANDKLAGKKFSITGLTGKWQLTSISGNQANFESPDYKRPVAAGFEKRRLSMAIEKVPGVLFTDMAKCVLGADAGKSSDNQLTPEQQLMLACYLLAHGDSDSASIQAASNYLSQASSVPETAGIQAEMENLKPVLREVQFQELKGELGLKAEAGDKEGAKALAARMKAMFPDLYERDSADIEGILKKN